jgi:hypothetical protein
VLLSLILLPAENESFLDDQQGNVKHLGNDFCLISQVQLLTVVYFHLLLLLGVPGKTEM